MTTYSSSTINLQASANAVFEKLSNLENLKGLLDKVPAEKIPEDKRDMFENIMITHDTISVPGGPMGNLTFKITERKAPTLISLSGEGVPIKISIDMNITPVSDNASMARIDFNLDIPALLKPMIGGQIQKMANQFGDVIASIPFS